MMRHTICPRGTWAATGRRDPPSRGTVQHCTLPTTGERRCHDLDLPKRPRAMVEDVARGRRPPACLSGSHRDDSRAVSAAAQAGCVHTSIAGFAFLPVVLFGLGSIGRNKNIRGAIRREGQWTGRGTGCLKVG